MKTRAATPFPAAPTRSWTMLAFSRVPTVLVVLVVLVSLLYAQSTDAQTAEPTAAGPTYTVTDLGVLPGDVGSQARAVNEAGQVAGSSDNYPSYDSSASASASASAGPTASSASAGPTASSASAPSAASASASAYANHAFVWGDDGDPATADMKDLGSLGTDGAGANGINDNGQVVGGSRDANGDAKAFLYENGSMRALGTPAGYRHAYAEDINNSGQAVGVASDYNYDPETNTTEESERAYMWHNGTETDLGTLAGSPLSYAQAINASGQVVGFARDPEIREVNYRPFLWENGSMTALPTLAGSIGSPARDINDQGHVVGAAYYPRNADGDAPAKAWIYKDGNATELPALPGYVSGTDEMEPTAINSSGQIVGFAEKLPGYTDTTSWLYSDGQMHNLKDLIPADSGWTDVYVKDINDEGQIVGSGKNASGERRAVLLTPDDQPQEGGDESTSQTFGAGGGTLSTDSENDGATGTDPVETSVTSPVGGPVSITETSATQGAPSGFTFFGEQVNIEAPQATTQNPLSLRFVLDASLVPSGHDATTLEVFRNGTLVGECAGASGTASPDPCVSDREALAGGDVAITVLTSHASAWNFAAPSYEFSGFFGPVDNRPIYNRLKAGGAVPVKFSLGGDMGLNVFAEDETGTYPRSGVTDCSPTANTDAIEQTVNTGSSSLTYDAYTDTYTYVWKTNKGWANSCRQLVLEFKDGGVEQRANFQFTR